MIYGILIAFYIFLCTVLMLLIMVQKGKSSMGLGSLGGGAQMLFGGSGGQDIFQKLTWILGTIFMASSLALAILKSREVKMFHYIKPVSVAQNMPAPEQAPAFPTETTTDAQTTDLE